MKPDASTPLQIARKAFLQTDYRSAQHFFQIAAKQDPANLEPLIKLSVCASILGQPRLARTHATSGISLADQSPAMLAELANQLSLVGESEAAYRVIGQLRPEMSFSSQSKASIAVVLHRIVKLDEALVWIAQAASEVNNDAKHANIHAFHGEMLRFHDHKADAHAAYEKAIRLDPGYAQSYWGRSLVKPATQEHNHVDNLRRILSRCKPNSRSEALVAYALFRELDDLGDHAAAWPILERAWRAKRSEKKYHAEQEAALFQRLSALTNKLKPADLSIHENYPTPIFILGQPRSGSTLLERVLAQHPDVHAAGELFDFIHQLHWCADLPPRGFVSIEAAERIGTQDLSNLGQRYLDHIKWRADGKKYVIDKLPPNYLLAAFIAKAIPHAIILHSVRDPVDTCYSQLKECFNHGYEHSYHPDEMAAHYLGYQVFMKQLHQDMPGRIKDCDHSEMINSPESSSGRLFDYCGLEFSKDYLSIETDRRPISTASSSQVRARINRVGVGRWQAYANQLENMREKLDT